MTAIAHSGSSWLLNNNVSVFKTYADLDGQHRLRLEQMAFEYGRYSESYLITEPNRSYLWSSCGNGVVGFVNYNGHIAVVGGLITPDENKLRFLNEISEFARLNKKRVMFFHIDDHDACYFNQAGYQVTNFGVNAHIPLADHSWNGKAFEWVRRQFNFVSRHGVAFEEWSVQDSTPAEWEQRMAELHEVSDEHIGAKHFRGEIPFFEGRLINDHLHRRRCFVARADNGAGRVEGFVLCTPLNGGRQWAMEMYRHRVDAVRGVIPFLMHQTIGRLKAEGCDGVSMCPVPAIGCDIKRPGDSFIARTALTLWNRLGSSLFDTNGLYHYKSRFRPEFSNMYLCSSSNVSVMSIWAYLRITDAFNLKIGAFLKDMIHLLNPQRRTLAKPVLTPQPTFLSELPVSPTTVPAAVPATSKAA
ncbi:MAG: DUF2156 domain-containing protein [Planctomycetota bacterium]|nr:DUF2156 domain-containing protein [Planctomycetota bacterium]MDA1212963.1 DUF2156 domain-containing protein [Planctomycetota bacterium]